MLLTLAALVAWSLRCAMKGTAVLDWNKAGRRLGFLAAAASASLLVSSNTVEAVLAPFGPGTFVSLFLLSLVGSVVTTSRNRHALRWILMLAASATGLLLIYQHAGFPTIIEPDARLLATLLVSLPFPIHEALHRRKSGHDSHAIVAAVMALSCLGAAIITAYRILPAWSRTTLPYWVNWQILMESSKDWRHLLVGVGAQNFLTAFTLGRPASLNMTSLWDARFTLGSSTAFHIATVYGLVGTAAFAWFLAIVHPVAALVLLLLPPSMPALLLASAFSILSAPSHHVAIKTPHLSRAAAALALLFVALVGYGMVRAYRAELSFARSLKALEQRDGTQAYRLQIAAITLNPRLTRYHTAYSQTNLALANALSQNATASADPEQIDRDRQTVVQLIQQAIREAKIGVNLAPKNILAWENIATVYQSLTNAAQGADQWTVASYVQAIQLDPTNPLLRLRLGGTYVGQQKFDLAADSYRSAITLKPDYANAYYNLAFAYRQQKKYLPAAQALKGALSYVTNPDDTNRAQGELNELRELLTEEEKRVLDATQIQVQPAPAATPDSADPLSPVP